jgi:plastocyanin
MLLRTLVPCLLVPLFLTSACGGDGDGDGGTGPPPQTATAISQVSGNGQTGVAGTQLAASFVVRVTDDQGSGVSGIGVAWDVTVGGGSLSSAVTQTNSQGQASVSLTLGPAAGANTVTASVTGLTGSPVTFNATGTAPLTPTTIVLVSGDDQNGKTLEPLASPLVVAVTDDLGTGIQGVTVSWAVTAGDGSLSASSSETDGQGQASITLTPGATLGDNTVTASVSGLTGSPITFTARTTVLVIEMVDIAFEYPDGGINSGVTVAVGDTIEWVNRDGVQHTATSNVEPAGGSAFDSGLMGNGATFRFVPDVAGTWEYLCEVHPAIMVGATITAQ